MSKTMTFLALAFLIHVIVVSTWADHQGPIQNLPDWEPMYAELGSVRGQRSYRSERELSKGHPRGENPQSRDSGINSRPSSSTDRMDRAEALFVTENTTVVTAQIGSTANLPCVVRNLGSGVASWIRRYDYHLLTVGMGTYSNDDRFFVSHNRPNQNWELHIKFVKPSDAGTYECQISTHPPSSVFIELRVVEAKAEILGQYDKHVRSGSNFELVCVLRNSTEPPVYVFWFHNDRMINYDNVRGVVVSSDIEKSILSIQEAQKSDSGNYTCQPSNASPSWIVVHILNGEKPAAMQHGSHNGDARIQPSPFFLLFSLLLTSWLTRVCINSGTHPTRFTKSKSASSPASVFHQDHPSTTTDHYYYLQEWNDGKHKKRVIKSTHSSDNRDNTKALGLPQVTPLTSKITTSSPYLEALLKDLFPQKPTKNAPNLTRQYLHNEFHFKLLLFFLSAPSCHPPPSPPSPPSSSRPNSLKIQQQGPHSPLVPQFLQSPTQSLPQSSLLSKISSSFSTPSSQSYTHSTSNFRSIQTFPPTSLSPLSPHPSGHMPLALKAR